MAYTSGVWGLRDHNIAGKLWLAPVRDAVSAGIWLAGFLTDRIQWRGLEYHVRNRLLEPVEDAQNAGLPQSAREVK